MHGCTLRKIERLLAPWAKMTPEAVEAAKPSSAMALAEKAWAKMA